MTNPQENKTKYIKKWSKDARSLSECSDRLPFDLISHQIKIYNACLDMAYIIEKEYSSLLSSIYSEVEAKRREYSNDDYHDYYNQAITDSLIIIKSKIE